MKKMISLNFVKIIFAGLLPCALFLACASSANDGTLQRVGEFSNAPAWVLSPEVKGKIADLGSAKPNAGDDFSLQRQVAAADARANLSNQINVKVSTMLKTFKSTTGAGTKGTYDSSIENVSKQISSNVLVGSKITKMWKSPKGTLYVLVVLDMASIKNQIGKDIKTSFKNDKAMYQKFLASKAQGDLDKELSKVKK